MENDLITNKRYKTRCTETKLNLENEELYMYFG